MAPEEAAKYKVLMEQKAEAEKKRKEKISYENNIKKQSEADRKQKETQ